MLGALCFHLFNVFTKGPQMNMWHQTNTWQSKDPEPAVVFAIGIISTWYQSFTSPFVSLMKAEGGNAQADVWRDSATKDACVHCVLKKNLLLRSKHLNRWCFAAWSRWRIPLCVERYMFLQGTHYFWQVVAEASKLKTIHSWPPCSWSVQHYSCSGS